MSRLKRTIPPRSDHTAHEFNQSRERILTLEQVADWLIVPPSTVRHWIVTGRLKGLKIGRYWRVRERDVLAFLESCEQKARFVEKSNEEPKGK